MTDRLNDAREKAKEIFAEQIRRGSAVDVSKYTPNEKGDYKLKLADFNKWREIERINFVDMEKGHRIIAIVQPKEGNTEEVLATINEEYLKDPELQNKYTVLWTR